MVVSDMSRRTMTKYSKNGSPWANRDNSTGVCPKSESGAHFWVIEEANGESSKGKCKYCDGEQEFLNSIPARYMPSVAGKGASKR